MPHLIPIDAVERLATLAGVPRFDKGQTELEHAGARIREQLRDTVEDAWLACFPTWLSLGRVRDLSRAIRVLRYWPSYENRLGLAFAEVYRDEYGFLVSVLRATPVESHEYLCACDLLELVACEFCKDDLPVPDEIYGLDCRIPRVIQIEVEHDGRYDHVTSIGGFFGKVASSTGATRAFNRAWPIIPNCAARERQLPTNGSAPELPITLPDRRFPPFTSHMLQWSASRTTEHHSTTSGHSRDNHRKQQ